MDIRPTRMHSERFHDVLVGLSEHLPINSALLRPLQVSCQSNDGSCDIRRSTPLSANDRRLRPIRLDLGFFSAIRLVLLLTRRLGNQLQCRLDREKRQCAHLQHCHTFRRFSNSNLLNRHY